jgi:Formyl transferase
MNAPEPMRTLLICHHDAPLHREGIARWLGSFSELTGMVVLHDDGRARWRRVRKEVRRSGWIGFADVLAFRLYYRLLVAARDRAWSERRLAELCERYRPIPAETPTLHCSSPNSTEAERFIRGRRPDLALALCKVLLWPQIFQIPRHGTYVLHPGICPEYRNAHGCFWALVRRDLQKVGMTLLRIDEGIDTGPVYGYYGYDYDERRESHVVIQTRVVLDNLDRLAATLTDVVRGVAPRLDTQGRASAVWGQPRLSSYLRWKREARRGTRAGDCAALS